MSAIALDPSVPTSERRAHVGQVRVRKDGPEVAVLRTVGRERLLTRIERELDQARPVSLRGGRGVGKSRLLSELSSRHIGPVRLLAGREIEQGAAAAPTVRDRPDGDRSLLLLVDDAQRLPSLEVARLHALQNQPWCRVVTTVSTEDGAALPAALGRWWLTERWRSLEVAPLTRTATAELLEQLLGGLPEPRLVHTVWRASGGHPVAIVELVRDAQELGSIVPGTDSWRQVGPLPVRRLSALVGDRLAGLTDAARHDLHVLALASPLPIRFAGSLLHPAAVKELEGRGLVRFRAGRAGRTLSIVDAVHAEVVRAGLQPEEHDQVLREVTTVLERCGSDAGRPLEVARWRLQIGGWSPQDLGTAAVHARCGGQTGLAEELAVAALQGGAGADVARLRALAGVELRAGRTAAPATDPLVGAQAAAIGAGRWSAAVESLRSICAGVPRSDALAYAAVLATLGGRVVKAEDLLAAGAAGPLAATAELLVAAERGDADAVASASQRVEPCEDGLALLPVADELARGSLLLVATEEPIEDRIEQAALEVDRALRELSSTTAWWYAVEGWLRWESGDLTVARRRLTSALLASVDVDPIRLRPRLLADLALLAALTSAVIEAQWRLGQVGDDRVTNPAVALRCEVTELLVAAQAAGEQPDATALVRLAELALQDGRDRDAAWAVHLVARLTEPGSIDPPAAELAAADPLVAAHLTAWAGADADALEEVARRLAVAGRRLLAAEAAAQAARRGAGPRSEALAAALAAGCPGGVTPLVAAPGPIRISPRRRDAAVLAMHGYDDRRIAAELGLSVRTVENHLAKVYRQVGVRGRGELAQLFDPSCPPFDRVSVEVG
ncbi:MAG: helix-turn-helix transcriptional regulator [Nitriliruptoraceae bacterium]